MRLDKYNKQGFYRGRSVLTEILWSAVQAFYLATDLPGSLIRIVLLRMFGAKIGFGVVIKPRVRVKFPWRLTIGDYVWIGEGVWIDNLEKVEIGSHSVISQGAYLCTGSHDWSSIGFDLVVRPIHIGDQCWVGAFGKLCPGAKMETGSVLGLGSVATGKLKSWSIYRGNPASLVKGRIHADPED